MIFLSNTTKGEQQNLVVQLEKRFPFGLYVNGSYAYMNAKSAFEATSSVAYSNWQFQTTNGDIYTQQLTRSFFEVPDRFNLVVSQAFKTGPLSHNVGLVYFAQSGQPYSILMGGDPNKDGASGNDQLFVPQNYSDIVWKGAGAPTEDSVEHLPLDDGPRQVPRPDRAAQRARRPVDPLARLPLRRDAADLGGPGAAHVRRPEPDQPDRPATAGLLRYVNFQTYTALNYSGIDSATGKPIYTVNSGALNEGRQYSTNDLRSRYQLKWGARVSF